MRTRDNLQQFVQLRRQLTEEKTSLEARLQEITAALGESETAAPAPAAAPTPSRPAAAPPRRGRPPGGGGQSLREHVLAVLASGPKTKEEVLAGVQQRGYAFSTSNPLNSLGVVLYGKNPKLNRANGRFSLRGGSAAAASAAASKAGGKRSMSPEARARIAEAQRRRWAAAGKAKTKAASGSAAAGAAAKPKRKMSAAGRKAIAEAARRRWAAAKAAGQARL